MKNDGIKKRFAGIFALLLLFACIIPIFVLTSVNVSALEDPVITDTTCAYLCNITNDRVLYSKNTELKVYPASTVKIMFALVAIENWNKDWDTEIVVTSDMTRGVTGNKLYLLSGETVTFRDMINGVVVGGANDCASVIAYELFGGTDEAVKLMNRKAAELDMRDTVYKNISGLHDPEMVTTLADTVKLAEYAITQYKYYDVASQYKFEMKGTERSGTRRIYTQNAFMTSYYTDKYYRSDVSGINVGYTDAAGYCAVVVAEHDGTSYLAAAMGSGSEGEEIHSFTTISSMLDWAYENFGYITVVKESEIIREVPVNMSATFDKVALYAKKTVDVFMEGDIDVQNDIKHTVVLKQDELDAPLKQGDVVGYLTISYNDEILDKVELVVRSDIPRSETMYISSVVGNFVLSDSFLTCVVIVVVLAVIYVLYTAFTRGRRSAASGHKKTYGNTDGAGVLVNSEKRSHLNKADREKKPAVKERHDLFK